jgi:hypothetical protein
MKFLIFNIAVTAALVYLLIGEGQMPGLDDVMSRTEKATTQVTNAIAGMVTPERQEPPMVRQPSAPQPPRAVVPAERMPISEKLSPANKTSVVASILDPKPRPDAPSPMVTASKTTLVPLPPAQTVARRQVKPVPIPTISHSLETAPPMATAKTPVFAETAAPKFMTPMERRRELYKLARSSEIFFIDRLSK